MSAETKNFIAGKWVATGSTFDSVNPATGELVSRCAAASQQELDAAVAAACDAFPAWRKTPPPRRAEICVPSRRTPPARKDDLARWITFEMGKVTVEARGDVQEAIDMARYMAGEGRRMFGQTAPSELRDKFCMSLRDPIGVVAVITPWNFPIAVPSWKILPAFVLGNTVVWKPSSDTPVCAAKFVEAFVEAGLPAGAQSRVRQGREIGDALVRHRDVRLVTFTARTMSYIAYPSQPPKPANAARWRWAARTRSSCSTTPTSRSRSMASCGARLAPVANAARPRAESSCTTPCARRSSSCCSSASSS
jgi:aldehyde dehydrogenase (NAD+)